MMEFVSWDYDIPYSQLNGKENNTFHDSKPPTSIMPTCFLKNTPTFRGRKQHILRDPIDQPQSVGHPGRYDAAMAAATLRQSMVGNG